MANLSSEEPASAGLSRKRAGPLPKDQRRAAIVAATVPLLREFGHAVSTRQVAEAAGVAEGTIFSVFNDKRSLMRAALEAAFDPEPLLSELAELPQAATVGQQIEAIAQVLRGGLKYVSKLTAVLHDSMSQADRDESDGRSGHDWFRENLSRQRRLEQAIADALAPFEDKLRVAPQQAAKIVTQIVFVSAHPFLAIEDDVLTDHQISELVLYGIAHPVASSMPAPSSRPQHSDSERETQC